MTYSQYQIINSYIKLSDFLDLYRIRFSIWIWIGFSFLKEIRKQFSLSILSETKVADSESQSIKINRLFYFYDIKIRKYSCLWENYFLSSSLILSREISFVICLLRDFRKFLLPLSLEFYFYIYFLFSFQFFLSPFLFSTKMFFSYQWRTFIYFFPIKFYRQALHLKGFLTESWEMSIYDFRLSERTQFLNTYVFLISEVSCSAKITNTIIRVVLFYNRRTNLLY